MVPRLSRTSCLTVATLCLFGSAAPAADSGERSWAEGAFEAAKRAMSRPVAEMPSAATPLPESTPVPEELLLDVGIGVFEMPPSRGEEVELRRAEGNYMAGLLKRALQVGEPGLGQWGAVRVVSRPSAAIDLAVAVRVERADAEMLALHVRATDARGVQWLDKRFSGASEVRSFDRGAEPFASVYSDIARDLANRLLALPEDELRSIREVAELRFIATLAPGAFTGYLGVNRSGVLEARRLPASEDPMLVQALRVRDREHLFIDTVDEYFTDFSADVGTRYSNWRRTSFHGVAARQRLLGEAQARELLGAIYVLDAIAKGAKLDGNAAASRKALGSLVDGAGLLQTATRKRQAAQEEAETLQAQAVAAGFDMLPATLTLENRARDLERQVADQYELIQQALAADDATAGTQRAALLLPEVPHFAPILPPAGEAGAATVGSDHLPSAVADAEAAIDLAPVGAGVADDLATVWALIEAGALDEALDLLHRLLPDPPQSTEHNGRELAAIYNAMAFAHYRAGDIDGAIAALEGVVAQRGDISKHRLAAAHLNLARLRFRQDDHAGAWQAMRAGTAAANVQQAACAMACSREARKLAAAVAREAAARDADNANCGLARHRPSHQDRLDPVFRQNVGLVQTQIDLGQAEAALAAIDRLLARHPHGLEHAMLWRYKAAAHSAMGDQAGAIQAYEKMLSGDGLVPALAEHRAVYDLAHLYMAAGNHERSLCYQRLWLHQTDFARNVCKVACAKPARSNRTRSRRARSQLARQAASERRESN